jgi:NAD(P)-dependent dehydrogenase (short-subunit alcohol dehydrogenase family)
MRSRLRNSVDISRYALLIHISAPSRLTIPSPLPNHQVNTIAPIILFQAFYPLLKASKSTPKFITMSSVAGSIATFIDTPVTIGGYSASKAALNSLTRKIHFENEWLVAFPLDPGPVVTEMGKYFRVLFLTVTMFSILSFST